MSEEAATETAAGAPPNLVDLLDALIEPPPPEPVSLLPQTWGWAVLGALLATAGALWLRRALLRRRAQAYRRDALRALEGAATAAETAAVIRRAALAAWPRQAAASPTGPEWLAFLDQAAPGALSHEAATELASAPWRKPEAPPSPALRAGAEAWLRRHRAPGEGAP